MNAPQAWMGIVIILNEALDELDAGPDAAGILPASAGTTQPFA